MDNESAPSQSEHGGLAAPTATADATDEDGDANASSRATAGAGAATATGGRSRGFVPEGRVGISRAMILKVSF